MKYASLPFMGQCLHEKRYPLACPFYDGSRPDRCEKCFVLIDPSAGDEPARIFEEYRKSIEHLPESSKETFRFFTRDLK